MMLLWKKIIVSLKLLQTLLLVNGWVDEGIDQLVNGMMDLKVNGWVNRWIWQMDTHRQTNIENKFKINISTCLKMISL